MVEVGMGHLGQQPKGEVLRIDGGGSQATQAGSRELAEDGRNHGARAWDGVCQVTNQDMQEEMQFHLESRQADLIRRGIDPAEAARQARIEFGSMGRHEE